MTTALLPVLDVKQAKALMRTIFETETLDVAVFVDRGWGESPLNISIIKDGDGQAPVALLTQETYKELLSRKVIGSNNLSTAKARKNHQFLGSRWMRNAGIGMLDVSEDYPKLTPVQKCAVRRAVQRFAAQGYKRAKVHFSGSVLCSTIRLASSALDLEFGAYQGTRYLSKITPVISDGASRSTSQ